MSGPTWAEMADDSVRCELFSADFPANSEIYREL